MTCIDVDSDSDPETCHLELDGDPPVRTLRRMPEAVVATRECLVKLATPSASLLALRGWQSGKPAAQVGWRLSLCLAQVARRWPLGGLSGIVIAQHGEG